MPARASARSAAAPDRARRRRGAIVHLAKLLVHARRNRRLRRRVRAAPARPLPSSAPRVSLIIPTRDSAEVLATCIRSIRTRTRYRRTTRSSSSTTARCRSSTKQLFAELARRSGDPHPAAAGAVQFLRASTMPRRARRPADPRPRQQRHRGDARRGSTKWWRSRRARRPAASARSCSIPDGRIQHAGVVLGLGGVAGHAHRFARGDDPGYLGPPAHACTNVSAVTAACLLIRRDVFDAGRRPRRGA